MKKIVAIITLIAVAGMTQAATLKWGIADSLEDTQSGQGSLYGGVLYATAGVDMYLVYNGVGGSFAGLEFDLNSGVLELAGTDTALSGFVFDTHTTDAADALAGVLLPQPLLNVGLASFNEVVASWEAMNTRSFTILAIKDTDGGDYSTGAWYGTYTGTPTGFSTGTGDNSLAFLTTRNLDASGSGLVDVVPEPATIGMLGLGALVAWFARRAKRLNKD